MCFYLDFQNHNKGIFPKSPYILFNENNVLLEAILFQYTQFQLQVRYIFWKYFYQRDFIFFCNFSFN